MDSDERPFGPLGALFGMAFMLAVLYLLVVVLVYAVVFLAVLAERISGRRLLPSLPGRPGPPAHWLR